MPDLISILDLIRKQSAINALVEEANQDGAFGYVDAKSIVDILTGLPTVDAAEVVRCKDCIFAHLTYDGECKYCDAWSGEEPLYLDGDFYCSFGEKVTE